MFKSNIRAKFSFIHHHIIIAGFVASLASTFVVGPAWARKDPQSESLQSQMFTQKLQDYAKENMAKGNPLPSMVQYLSEVYTDRVAKQILDGHFERPLFRDALADQAIDVLIREKGRYPILVGEPGSGKTTLTDLIAYKILAQDYPESEAHQKALNNAVIFRVSARNFLPGGSDISAYLGTVNFISQNLNRKIIVVLYESHFLNDYNVSVLRELADKESPLPVVLETDSKSYGATLKNHPSFHSLSKLIQVPPFSNTELKTLLLDYASPKLKQRFRLELSPDLVDAIIEVSPDYSKTIFEPRRSLTLAEEFVIDWQRQGRGQEPTRVDLYRFVARAARLPVIPQNKVEFSQFLDSLRERVKKRVVGQNAIVDGLVDQFQASLTSSTRQHSVALIMGPTGVGKTLAAEVLGEEFYQDKSRILTLDMTQFGDSMGLSVLFGASNGIISSDKDKGVINEFLDGRGHGGGVIILNEIEEAHGDVITRLMELFDKGEVRGGDGRVRYLGRSLIVMTSNKNTDKIMSPEAITGMTPEERSRRLSLITQEQLKKSFTEKASYTQSSAKVVKPAVLERVDKIYFASPLLAEEAVSVASLEVEKYVSQHNRQNHTQIEVDPSFARVLTLAFYNPSFGGRQLRTAVQQSVSRALAEFQRQYGHEAKNLRISAEQHISRKTITFVSVSEPGSDRKITIDGPRVPVTNKMHDPEFRERLTNLEKNLRSEIFGQDESIRVLSAAVKSRILRGGKDGVVAGFLLGSTGTGKSELAKSLTKHLFGRPDAYALFDMGQVMNEHDMNNIFSPPKGIVGADEPGQLEKFLIAQPDGGVLLFDEMSNAGGGNKALKEAIAKQFYTILEEGTFTSPSGKVYDLSNYVLIMTGNDGEKIFRGLSSDSLLEETYKDATKDPGKVRQLLLEAGFSEAFIGRLAFASLMHPTLSPTKALIARKMINQWKAQVEKEHPLNIEYDEEFTRQIGLLMFSAQSGARSIKHFIAQTLGQSVANEALKLDWEKLLSSGQRSTIKLSLFLDQATLPFYDDKPYTNKAILNVETRDGDTTTLTAVDFTKSARFMPQVHRDSALATAYHEMGHLVTSFTETTGKKPVKITIIPERIGESLQALGYAQYRSVPTKGKTNRDFLVKNIAGLLAGSEAELLIGEDRSTGRSNDVERVGKMARAIILENHLIPELDAAKAYVSKEGELDMEQLPEEVRALYNRYVKEAIAEARALAIKTLKQNWHVVVAGSELLMRHGNLNERDIERLLARGDEALQKAAWYKKALVTRGYSNSLTNIPLSLEGIVEAPTLQHASCEQALTHAK